jgi:hypothetical protein
MSDVSGANVYIQLCGELIGVFNCVVSVYVCHLSGQLMFMPELWGAEVYVS